MKNILKKSGMKQICKIVFTAILISILSLCATSCSSGDDGDTDLSSLSTFFKANDADDETMLKFYDDGTWEMTSDDGISPNIKGTYTGKPKSKYSTITITATHSYDDDDGWTTSLPPGLPNPMTITLSGDIIQFTSDYTLTRVN